MTHLEEQLDRLKNNLTDLGQLVKTQISKSKTALMNRDVDLANEVIYHERRVNAFELKIDKDCEETFALFAPVANDMRLVFSTLKINGDLERIGDYAEGIAKILLLQKMDFDQELINTLSLPLMYDKALKMLEDVIIAYASNDSKLARSVFSRDAEINEINHSAIAITTQYCQANTARIQQALYLLSIIRRLERMGDHITNIAEEIIFFREALVLRHGNKGGDSAWDIE
ncbi:MAG TPA: phosphate signaling complex protein PhoU [Chitinophagaceae bacterium]